jgi:hypothetical protein
MFGQLLPNKNKIATVWHGTYYAKFGSKFWNLNMALLLLGNGDDGMGVLRPVSMEFHQIFMDINYADVAPY